MLPGIYCRSDEKQCGIMICGSLAMQNDMTRIPETSFKERNNHEVLLPVAQQDTSGLLL